MKKKKSSSSTRISSSYHSNLSQIFSHVMRANTMKTSKELKSTSQACNFCSKASMRTCKNHKPIPWKRKEQEMLAREIQEVQKSQINQTLVNNKRAETEKNLQQVVERQGRDIAEMRKQLTLWTRNTSTREAHTCWAHQQANLNLSEIPITQIPDLMQTNAEKGRPVFFGCLKLDYGAGSSSQTDQQEPVPLRTALPIPGYQPQHPPPN
ncbi:hypothetical protein PIB30_080016 [Stylosanthes scabra]|uniref:Uncharacterized protein n=1 Tax=Stylosanthes scabra TaxID=79078 RepID=A0ABU6UQV7_9FABA|nr:hypothetical protein [Stylosanthes scabra]